MKERTIDMGIVVKYGTHLQKGIIRTVREYRKMKVIGVYPHIVTLEDKNGVKESFQWEEFFRKRKSKG